MSTYPFADCQGLAGAWTLGTVMTGRFDLVHRCSQPGGFGDIVMDNNRELIPGDWEMEDPPGNEWEPQQVAYVCGTPPCSGFSLMNASKGANKRGPDSPINSCMVDLAEYGARCTGSDGKPGAEVIAFESVQQAFTTGQELMQTLRSRIEKTSGQQYDLTHVMMSGASIGASQYRHRYYFVAHRIPFGADHPEPRRVATYADAIDDLRGLKLQWEDQPYQEMPTDWAAPLHRVDGMVDAHISKDVEGARIVDLLGEVVDRWSPGENMSDVIAELDEPPPTLIEKFPYTRKDWKELRGWSWPSRIRPDKPGYVVAGGSADSFVHYSEPRFLTVRELSRLMGYPDDWRWPDGLNVGTAGALIGKCCPRNSGQWLSDWVARALDGEPGEQGEQIGDREYLHNSSLDYRRWPYEVSGWRLRDEVRSSK
jgi:site-specific DNA-cytosine methylase